MNVRFRDAVSTDAPALAELQAQINSGTTKLAYLQRQAGRDRAGASRRRVRKERRDRRRAFFLVVGVVVTYAAWGSWWMVLGLVLVGIGGLGQWLRPLSAVALRSLLDLEEVSGVWGTLRGSIREKRCCVASKIASETPLSLPRLMGWWAASVVVAYALGWSHITWSDVNPAPQETPTVTTPAPQQ
jgi:hypothetical protein